MSEKPLRAVLIYAPAMCIAGVVLGYLITKHPAWAQDGVNPFFMLLGVSLVFDLSFGLLAAKRPVIVLSIYQRAAGFFAGAILYIAMLWAFGSEATALVLNR